VPPFSIHIQLYLLDRRLDHAQIIDGEVLCVHGGLSPDIRALNRIRVPSRAQDILHEGTFYDLMWSDPDDIENWDVSPRGVGSRLGGRVTRDVCPLSLFFSEGYKYMLDEALATVSSAPNYCYRYGNVAPILTAREDGARSFTV